MLEEVDLIIGAIFVIVFGLFVYILKSYKKSKMTESVDVVVADAPAESTVEELSVKKPRKPKAPKIQASVKKPRKPRAKQV